MRRSALVKHDAVAFHQSYDPRFGRGPDDTGGNCQHRRVETRVFTQVDYATYGQTLLSYQFAAPFVVLGLNQALFYFLPNEKGGLAEY